MKKIILLVLLMNFSASFPQSVNDYKYVIVPSKFDFVGKKDEYRLNTFTKSLLEKYGFIVFYDTDRQPTELVDSNCNKLYADLQSEGSFIKTKLVLYLRDCKKNVLFSADGFSREKEYGASYNIALREISKDFNALNYKYNGNEGMNTGIKTAVQATSFQTAAVASDNEILFAQPLPNGFQLVDSTPKVVMRILNTSAKDVFIAEQGQTKGMLYNKNGVWTFEYYSGETLIAETLNIKF